MGDKVPIETYNQICGDLDLANEKIERLKKENEWLLKKCAGYEIQKHGGGCTFAIAKTIAEMQQALKEEE